MGALFARKAEFLSREPFANIGESDAFNTKIVGVSFGRRQDAVAGLLPGTSLDLVREPENEKDPNAIAVRFGQLQLGYIRAAIAKQLVPNIDAGDRYSAVAEHITGGGDKHVGVNIAVRRHRRAPPRVLAVAGIEGKGTVAADELRRALIGDRPIREQQQAVLERVAAGRNTLAVFGTGRGKSLCFQLPAGERALRRGEKTLVFYPLRALANDQYDALSRRFEPFGIRLFRANGSIGGEERAALDAALQDGAWDIVMATPEFATYHRAAFARPQNLPSLVVVDEAHHLFESRHRQAYAAFGELLDALGRPQVLALTATAREDAFRHIRKALAIDAWVIDPTVRENLRLVEARGIKDKIAYMERELDGDGKAIIYCNSRPETVKVAERLRRTFGDVVAFYHAGVPAAERGAIEEFFRAGALRVIVATTAFGEGIDLPDVRNVVLYHLNFAFTEFNQQAGRAGRDGDPARIHLLYGEADRRINDFIISRDAPSLAVLRELYRGMRNLSQLDVLRMSFADIAATLDHDMVADGTVSSAVKIWEEAGLVESGRDDDGRFVRFLEFEGKVDLTKTTRFAEGEAERESFERFCKLALEADVASLESVVNRPIYPDRIALRS